MKHIFVAGLLLSLSTTVAAAQDWRTEYKTVRFGVLSGENEKDRIARFGSFETYLENELGVDVEIFTAGSYDGVVQALAADQIEFAFLGSSAYAAAYTETEGGVVPLAAKQEGDGSTGYNAIIVTRCDSGYKSIADLKDKVFAFADPDSTSGYAVPYFNLVKQGYEPESFFGTVTFSGAHESGIQGVVNGQYDAAATNQNSETNGYPQRMVAKGMIKEGEVCTIWKSPDITTGPFTARKNLPQSLIGEMQQAVVAVSEKSPETFKAMDGGATSTARGYVPVNHEQYEWIIEMREWLKQRRRTG